MAYPLLSVIVPVYNVENVLNHCIDSILNQTYPNIEIILVDDGSKDESGCICDDYARRYSNIKVFHEANGGASSARNKGLTHATGEYIGFVDSDDYISSGMYQYLYELIKQYGADVSSIDIVSVYEYGLNMAQPEEKIVVKSGADILRYYMERTTKQDGYSVCRCLFKKNLLEGYSFREGCGYEDIDYKFMALSYAKKFVDSNQVYYYYIQTQDSASFAPFKPKDFDLVLASEILFELCSNTGDDELIYYAKVRQLRTPFSLLVRIAYMGFAHGYYTKQEEKSIIKTFTKQLRKGMPILFGAPIPVTRKIAAVILCLNFELLHIPLTIYRKIRSRNLIKK